MIHPCMIGIYIQSNWFPDLKRSIPIYQKRRFDGGYGQEGKEILVACADTGSSAGIHPIKQRRVDQLTLL